MIDIYNFIVPVLFLFLTAIMILDAKKYLNTFNGCIGIFLGGLIGIKLGEILFDNLLGGLVFFIIFITGGFYINRIKKIEYVMISGLSWGVFAVIVLSVLKIQTGELIFFGILFFILGVIFSFFYYSEVLMISGFSFFGANILFISIFFGLENITENMFEIFRYPFPFFKFIHIYRTRFFFFLLICVFFIIFSVCFQIIKDRKTDNKKTLMLNNVLNESGYVFAIYFFLSEIFRIILGQDTIFIFGVSPLNWPVFIFITYWIIAYIKKQEQVDLLIGIKKKYKSFLYIFIYSVFFIPVLAFLTNFGKYNLSDFFHDSIWIYLPRWIFTIVVLPLSIYLIYPKSD